jgi:ATP-dependent helicase/nuclease subunit A
MGCVLEEVPDWGLRLRYSGNDVAHSKVAKGPENEPEWSMAENEPSWLRSNAPIDASPPRPLAPSNLDDDDYGVVPDSRRLRAAERGRILHRLFELYNGSDAGDFLNFAKDWLKRNPGAADLDHGAVLDSFGSIITHSEWQHYFCSNARAEVPLASVVGKTVITGRVDRLVVDDDRVLVIDFKTGSRVPASQEDVPVALLRQMAHYKAALQTIFPKKRVEAALLFTHGPRFMTLSEDILASHMQSIGA